MTRSDLKKLIKECINEVIYSKEEMGRKNPFHGHSTVSGWLLKNGEFKWAQSISSHDDLAISLGYKSIEDLRDNHGAIRVWADGDEKIITLSVDRFNDMSPRLQNRVEDLALEYSAAIRDDRGNIVVDYRDQ
jgi:hypothetical protein